MKRVKLALVACICAVSALVAFAVPSEHTAAKASKSCRITYYVPNEEKKTIVYNATNVVEKNGGVTFKSGGHAVTLYGCYVCEWN